MAYAHEWKANKDGYRNDYSDQRVSQEMGTSESGENLQRRVDQESKCFLSEVRSLRSYRSHASQFALKNSLRETSLVSLYLSLVVLSMFG